MARIEAGNVPERLTGCRIYELDLGNLLASTDSDRGAQESQTRRTEWEEEVQKEEHL